MFCAEDTFSLGVEKALHQLHNKIYSHMYVWLQTGLGLVIGFIEHLQIVTTHNYSAITNSHNLQFTTARTKSSQYAVASPVVAWWRIPTVSSASVLMFLLVGNSFTTNSLFLLSYFRHGPHTKHRSSVSVSIVVELASIWMPTWSPLSHCLAILSNGCCIIIYLAVVA
jgi:hypothetical protein